MAGSSVSVGLAGGDVDVAHRRHQTTPENDWYSWLSERGRLLHQLAEIDRRPEPVAAPGLVLHAGEIVFGAFPGLTLMDCDPVKPEVPRSLGRGTAYVTSQRVAFVGQTRTRDWKFAQLQGIHHEAGAIEGAAAVGNGTTWMHVGTRVRISGLYGDEGSLTALRGRIEVALLVMRGEYEQRRSELHRQLAEHDARQPRGGWVPRQRDATIDLATVLDLTGRKASIPVPPKAVNLPRR